MIKLKPYDVIKHKKFMDVAIQITKPPIITKSGKLKIKGNWMNQAYVESFIIGKLKNFGKSELVIMPENIKDWLVCLNPHANCVRNEKWIRLV